MRGLLRRSSRKFSQKYIEELINVFYREPATFTKQLDQSVAAIAKPILESLNKTQQRAALKVLTANDYYLIKGMPGSGKTRTLVATIQLLVKMGKSVLLTAHTHSAVDNVLLKLIKTDVDFVRLGSSTKIHPDLESKSESALTKNCYSPESLDAAYNSKVRVRSHAKDSKMKMFNFF